MRFVQTVPPRTFRVGLNSEIEISDCGRIHLEADEQVTFVTPSGKEHDFVAKSWGFYATPSVNSRLVDQGFKTALVSSPMSGRFFIMVVERERIDEFEEYLRETNQVVVEWLDERQ
jgi:hypothetical protein